MLLEFARELNKRDEDLSIEIKASNSTVQANIRYGVLGEIYSYSSTSLLDVENHIDRFIKVLDSSEEYTKLFQEVENEPLEV